MRTHTTRSLAAAAALAAVTGLVSTTSPAAMANDDDRIARGSCARSTDWKVKASPESGRIEIEGEVDSSRAGQTWRWALFHNGSVSAAGSRVTRGPSGSFGVRRVSVDMGGTDTFVFRARNVRSGEVCRGSVNF